MKAHTALLMDLKPQKIFDFEWRFYCHSQFLKKPFPPQLSLNPSLCSAGHDHLAVCTVKLNVIE
jgi:hypothetical protein